MHIHARTTHLYTHIRHAIKAVLKNGLVRLAFIEWKSGFGLRTDSSGEIYNRFAVMLLICGFSGASKYIAVHEIQILIIMFFRY